MTEEEIERRLQRRLDKDEQFKGELEDLIARGLYKLAEELIEKVVGVVVDLSKKFWDWLKSLFE